MFIGNEQYLHKIRQNVFISQARKTDADE